MIDLTGLNTLRVPAKTKKLTEINSPDEISASLLGPAVIIGQGANLLLRSPLYETVVVNKLTGFDIVKDAPGFVDVEFASGHPWHDAVMWSVEQNLSGLENMALIPGTIGAAAIGNIGAYGGNQEDLFISLKAVDLNTGKKRIFTKPEMKFAYRESIFKNELAGKYFVVSVTYRLSKTAHLELSYHAARHASLLPELQKIAKEPYTVKDVAKAVINIRTAKLPDWKVVRTAGSFFKNPVVGKITADKLKSRIPDLQTYPVDKLMYTDPSESEKYVKLPAGMLLDELGWKGKKIGNVSTSPNHALIIIAHAGATGREIYEFSQSMRADVRRNFGIGLEYEVVII